jgi:uncharacterized protein (DUF427 family)
MDTTTTTRGRVTVERGAKRVRVYLSGQLVADTSAPLLVWETPYYPTYYFPVADVIADLVTTGQVDHSPSRGDAERFHIRVGAATAQVEALGACHIVMSSPIDALRGHCRIDWAAMDAWFEEDEQIHTHPRDPHRRVDVLHSSRRVQVRADDVVLADTTHVAALFETGLPTRWYLHKTDVRMDLLVPSATVTHCPYKGEAEYYSLRAGTQSVDDVAWSYTSPFPESQKVAGMIAFMPSDRLSVTVEGE